MLKLNKSQNWRYFQSQTAIKLWFEWYATWYATWYTFCTITIIETVQHIWVFFKYFYCLFILIWTIFGFMFHCQTTISTLLFLDQSVILVLCYMWIFVLLNYRFIVSSLCVDICFIVLSTPCKNKEYRCNSSKNKMYMLGYLWM